MFDPDRAEAVNTVRQNIDQTTRADADHWPISFQCFVGTVDGVVPEALVRGPYDNVSTLRGPQRPAIR